MSQFTLTLFCPDRKGIVNAVAAFLVQQDCNITDSAQFGDIATGKFFMRVSIDAQNSQSVSSLTKAFAPVSESYSMQATFHDSAKKARVAIMVSKHGHCLNDLLYRHRIGALRIEIPVIISNHRDHYKLAASQDIPFQYLPVTPESKVKQEARLMEIIQEEQCDLVVLARYMQILSPSLCASLAGRAINIHHSFLPSFKGAKPYRQAHDRGVKLIGATAHYVTADLDDGPIIEQDVARVDHRASVDECAAIGHYVESAVLARAVQWHVEHKILLNGNRTIVFG